MRAALIAVGIAIASPASAATIHGLVFDDINHDGLPSVGEPGVANAVVAVGVKGFIETDATGHFDLVADAGTGAIVWVRVPDGFVPGPVFARWDGANDVDLALERLPAPVSRPLTFVVAADTHIGIEEPGLDAPDLARVARLATALDPAPAFFTLLGDVTTGSKPEQYDTVDRGLADLDVPYIPVPGNHDWYDGGAAWFAHYGPDNYSFDLGGVHFAVWNMAISPAALRVYLGADLARVPASMPVVVLTHDPPHDQGIEILRELGVDYVLTGHTHSNRVVDHGGMIELNTEPLLMGGLDFTPAGYRVVTIEDGRLSSYHRTVVDEPFVALVKPAADTCSPVGKLDLLVAVELGAGMNVVSARVDSTSPVELSHTGGWMWGGTLPALFAGDHQLVVEAVGPRGVHKTLATTLRVCADVAVPPVTAGADWPQLGRDATHAGRSADLIAPPLASRWVTALDGNVLTSAPIIAGGLVYVATTDLANGDAGGVTAMDLATGAIRWTARTDKPIRGGLAAAAGVVITTQIDGVVLAFDAATGEERWRRAMSTGFAPQAGAVFSPPTVAGDAVFLGHQRDVAALAPATGDVLWSDDPVPEAKTSQSSAAIAVGQGLAVGVFNRALGGVIAWDAATGEERWRYTGGDAVAINASPVIGDDSVYLVSGTTDVLALDLAGNLRWRTRLHAEGFDWGQASVGTPALAGDKLIVPTLYGSLVALDAKSGGERWRYNARSGPLRGTHYRGTPQPAFAASPIVTGDLVWVVDTSGLLSALDVRTGLVQWLTELPSPVLAGLAASGDWLVIASYDGSVRGMTCAPGGECEWSAPDGGCCNTGGGGETGGLLGSALALLLVRRRRRA